MSTTECQKTSKTNGSESEPTQTQTTTILQQAQEERIRKSWDSEERLIDVLKTKEPTLHQFQRERLIGIFYRHHWIMRQLQCSKCKGQVRTWGFQLDNGCCTPTFILHPLVYSRDNTKYKFIYRRPYLCFKCIERTENQTQSAQPCLHF